MDNRLKFIKKDGDYDYYEYSPKIIRLFYKDYEKLTIKRRIRFMLEYIRGYKIYYMYKNKDVIGYCLISRGGGVRMKFTNYDDIVVGPYYVVETMRGQGRSVILIQDVLNKMGIKYKYAYDYIRKNNIPSIKASERVGFEYVSSAKISKNLRAIQLCDNNEGEFVIYRYERK